MERNLKDFFKYSTLSVLGMIGLSCYILGDTYFVSCVLGKNGLAALNLSLPVYSFVHGSGLMVGMGGATKYTVLKSRNQHSMANRIFSAAVYITMLFSALFAAAGFFFSEKITAFLGADTEIFEMTDTYLKIILLFAPLFMFNDLFICFVRNDGDPRLSMLAMIIGNVSNVILDYIFMYPFKMGIFGAVLATGFAAGISMAVLSVHKWKKKNTFRLVVPAMGQGVRALALGLPSLVAEVSSGIVMLIFNIIVLSLEGNTGIAAYGIIANLSLVAISVYTGLSQGAQPLISAAYGRGERQSVKRLFVYALTAVGILSAVIYSVVFFGAEPITTIFNSEGDAALQRIAVSGLKIYFTAMLFAGFNIVISVFFTSVERPLPAHVISLLRGLVLIVPVTFLLGNLWELTGVWLAFPVTELLVALLGIGMYFRLNKKKQ